MTSAKWVPLILKQFRTGDPSPRSFKLTIVLLSSPSSPSSPRYYSSWRQNSNDDDEGESTPKKRRAYRSSFVDSVRLHVKAGTGGQGLPTHGGAGGKGGDIIVKAGSGSKEMTLKHLLNNFPTRRVSAPTGADARFFCLYGEAAKPVEFFVPLGISVISEEGHKIGEINKAGDRLVIAKGGNGGCAANGFSAQTGQAYNVTLDLKLIADVGFVGFPNAGKSTLLKAISHAQPKIASYPFTTVKPNLGVLEFPDFRKITLADLPGLIEGAHANMGMGHKFLKHVERTKMLMFIVDIHGFQLSPQFSARSALETIALLNKELELYNGDLTTKPAILALNKVDLPNSFRRIEEIRTVMEDEEKLGKFWDSLPESFRPTLPIKFDKIVPISAAKDMQSVNQLKQIIRTQLDINDEYEAVLRERAKGYAKY